MSEHITETLAFIFERVHTALLTRDFRYAEQLLLHTLRKYPDAQEADRQKIEKLLARVYVNADELEKALDSYLHLYAVYPDDTEIMNTLGVIYRQLHRFEDSLQILERVKENSADDENVLYNLGKTYCAMQQYDTAIECFTAAIEKHPDNTAAYDQLGGVYALRNEHEKAINVYENGLQHDPNDPILNFHLASLLRTEQRFEEAIDYYTAALRTRPAWGEALRCIAQLYTDCNRFEDALAAYKSLIRISGRQAAILTEMGLLFEKNQLDGEAERHYREALVLDKCYAPAVLALSALAKRKQYTESVLPLLIEAESCPVNAGNRELCCETIETCIHEKEYAKAQEFLQKVTTDDAEDCTVLKLQVKLAAVLGDTVAAENLFEKLAAGYPSEAGFRKDLAEQYLKTRQYKEAKKQLLLFLQQQPQDIQARLMLGEAEDLLGNYAQAHALYEQLIDEYPDNIESRSALTRLFQKNGNTLDALNTVDEMLSLQATGTDNTQGLAEALDLYEQAVQDYTKDPAFAENLRHLHIPLSEPYIPAEELVRNECGKHEIPLLEDGLAAYEEVSFDVLLEKDNEADLQHEYQQSLPVIPLEALQDTSHSDNAASDPDASCNDHAVPVLQVRDSEVYENAEEEYAASDSNTLQQENAQKADNSLPSESPMCSSAFQPAVEVPDLAEPTQENPEIYIKTAGRFSVPEIITRPEVQASDKMETSPEKQPHYEAAHTPHEEMLNTAVQSLHTVVSYLADQSSLPHDTAITDSIAEKVSDKLLHKIHEFSSVLPIKTDSNSEHIDSNEKLADSDTAGLKKETLQIKHSSFASTPLSVEPEELAGLLLYLRELSAFLPKDKQDAFLSSEQRAQSDYIISCLSGEIGLKERMLLTNAGTSGAYDQPLTGTAIIELLEYLKQLVQSLSDKGLMQSCSRLLDEVILHLKEE